MLEKPVLVFLEGMDFFSVFLLPFLCGFQFPIQIFRLRAFFFQIPAQFFVFFRFLQDLPAYPELIDDGFIIFIISPPRIIIRIKITGIRDAGQFPVGSQHKRILSIAKTALPDNVLLRSLHKKFRLSVSGNDGIEESILGKDPVMLEKPVQHFLQFRLFQFIDMEIIHVFPVIGIERGLVGRGNDQKPSGNEQTVQFLQKRCRRRNMFNTFKRNNGIKTVIRQRHSDGIGAKESQILFPVFGFCGFDRLPVQIHPYHGGGFLRQHETAVALSARNVQNPASGGELRRHCITVHAFNSGHTALSGNIPLSCAGQNTFLCKTV